MSSSDSSPETHPKQVLQPRNTFDVHVSKHVTKNGSDFWITIECSRDSKTFKVKRVFEDFQYLNHQLLTSHHVVGLVAPPLPPKPPLAAQEAQDTSRRHLGRESKTLFGDQILNKDLSLIQIYLRQMVAHPVFGHNPALEQFLTMEEAPPRPKINSNKSLFTRVSESLDTWKQSHVDLDQYFQRERDVTLSMRLRVKEAAETAQAVVSARRKLAEVMGHLAAALSYQDANQEVSKVKKAFGRGFDEWRKCLEMTSRNEEMSFFAFLDFFKMYFDQLISSLLMRTQLQLKYENANHVFDKQRSERAKREQLEAEEALDTCSEVLRHEIKRFHCTRVQLAKEALVRFAEAHVVVEKDTLCVLQNTLDVIKNL